jgi:hypothetical protein
MRAAAVSTAAFPSWSLETRGNFVAFMLFIDKTRGFTRWRKNLLQGQFPDQSV